MYFRLYVKKSGAFAKCKKCVCFAHLRQQGAPRKVLPCGLFRCYPSAHTACASGERGCPCCGTLRPAGRSPAPEQREDRGENGCRKAPSERPAQRWPGGYANATDTRAPARLWRHRTSSCSGLLSCAGRIAAPPGRSPGHDRTKVGASSDAARKGLST